MEEYISWWVGLDRISFYEYIKTYHFAKYKYKAPFAINTDMTRDYNTKHNHHQSDLRVKEEIYHFIAAAQNIPRTNFTTDEIENEKLEPIPYHEWNN